MVEKNIYFPQKVICVESHRKMYLNRAKCINPPLSLGQFSQERRGNTDMAMNLCKCLACWSGSIDAFINLTCSLLNTIGFYLDEVLYNII